MYGPVSQFGAPIFYPIIISSASAFLDIDYDAIDQLSSLAYVSLLRCHLRLRVTLTGQPTLTCSSGTHAYHAPHRHDMWAPPN